MSRTNRKQSYIRVDTKRGGVRVTLSGNAWVVLRLFAGYFLTDLTTPGPETDLGQDVTALQTLMPAIPTQANHRTQRRADAKKTHVPIPASKVQSLITLMEYAVDVRAGFMEGPLTNIGTCLVYLNDLSTIDLLGAVSGE